MQQLFDNITVFPVSSIILDEIGECRARNLKALNIESLQILQSPRSSLVEVHHTGFHWDLGHETEMTTSKH